MIKVEANELDPVPPGVSQAILDELDGHHLAAAAAVAESERRVAGRVAYRVRRAVDHSVDSAECAVGQFCPKSASRSGKAAELSCGLLDARIAGVDRRAPSSEPSSCRRHSLQYQAAAATRP